MSNITGLFDERTRNVTIRTNIGPLINVDPKEFTLCDESLMIQKKLKECFQQREEYERERSLLGNHISELRQLEFQKENLIKQREASKQAINQEFINGITLKSQKFRTIKFYCME